MTEREQVLKLLEEAEAFLEKHGGAEPVQEFLESEETRKLISDTYAEMMELIVKYKNNAPEILAERAEKMYELFANREYDFTKDVELNVKVRVYKSFVLLPEALFRAVEEHGLLAQIFKEGQPAFMKDLKEIIFDMKKYHIESFLESIYQAYVPEGMTEDLAELLKMIGGGNVLLPITAIFPELGEEESSEDVLH